MKVTILGCGGAPGVPTVSSGWGRCDPKNPKNRRRRSSVLVNDGTTQVLVDTSPDLRDQLLDAEVRHLDGVLYTHGHADHMHGLDELREINRAMKAPLPIYATADTLAALETRFGYAFEGIPEGETYFRPWLMPNVITGAPFTVKTLQAQPFVQSHGFSTTMGFRMGDMAYSTDVWDLDDTAKAMLTGLSVWIVGALTDTPHPTHAHLDKVLGWIDELKPRRAVITHMGPTLDYETLVFHLPVGVTPAFDGMVIEV